MQRISTPNGRLTPQFVQDLFATPRTLYPVTFGTVFVMAGWAVSTPWMVGLGLGLAIVGVALGMVRLITDGEQIMFKVIEREKTARLQQETSRLESLKKKLETFPSPDIRKHLKSLRALKDSFEDLILQDEVAAFVTSDFQARFQDLFWKSVAMMERAHKIHETAKGMTHKEGLHKTRDAIISEVGENVAALTQSFEGLTTLAMTHDEGGLDVLRKDLESKLSVAEAVEEELGGVRDIDQEMKEYLQ